jgi:sec-independent protein translocase protein TatB
MLDLGWTELLVIGVVALIVIGPRDLPLALHTFGKYVGKLKAMAREFQSSVDDIARQHELKELQEGINKFSSPEQAIENYVSGLEKKGAKPAAINDDSAEKANLIGQEPDAVKDWSAEGAETASPAGKAIADDTTGEPPLPLETAITQPPENAEKAAADEPELPLGSDVASKQSKPDGMTSS